VPADEDGDVEPPELPGSEDNVDDLDSQFETNPDDPEWEYDEPDAPMAGRNTGGTFRRLPVLITAAIVATLVIIGLAVLFQSRTAAALRPYNSTDTVVRFTIRYPESWTALKGVASDVVFSPDPHVGGATFFQGSADQWGSTRQLLSASPERAVGAYAFAEFTGTDTTSTDVVQQAVSALTPSKLVFLATDRQLSVGGATARELEGDVHDPSSPVTRLHVMFDVVQPPSGGTLLLTFFASPDQFSSQLPLFTQIRDSVRFLN